jgi:hypothetical protein
MLSGMTIFLPGPSMLGTRVKSPSKLLGVNSLCTKLVKSLCNREIRFTNYKTACSGRQNTYDRNEIIKYLPLKLGKKMLIFLKERKKK